MILAVIDTNVFVSSFLTKHDDAATLRLVRAMGSGRFIPLYNEGILSEYREVLSRRRFGITKNVVDALISKIREMGLSAHRVHSDETFPDEDNRVFYEVVLSHADEGAKLVTGNAKHFPSTPIVVTASEFCALIGV